QRKRIQQHGYVYQKKIRLNSICNNAVKLFAFIGYMDFHAQFLKRFFVFPSNFLILPHNHFTANQSPASRMAKNRYQHLTKQELLHLIEEMQRARKYGLVWNEERTEEQVAINCRQKTP